MIPTTYVLGLSLTLFFIGLFGVIIRRNALIVMMSVELMLNAVNVALIGFSRAWGTTHGQGLVFFVIALAAAEAAVGLAIVVAIFRTRRTVNVDEINLMRN
jgi:NADH-quinone oxidoreductase subunit K